MAWVRERAIPTDQPTDRFLSAKLVLTFVDRGCHGRILGFLDRSRYFSFKSLLNCTHEAKVDPILDLLLLRKSGSTGNQTRAYGSVARNHDY
jgi:hypothetical protein